MPKITVNQGTSFDPYVYPELQPTTGPEITSTDIKEVADQSKDIEYVEEGDESSVGNNSSASENKLEKTEKKNSPKAFLTARTAEQDLKKPKA